MEPLNDKNPAEKTEVALVCCSSHVTHMLTLYTQFLARSLRKCAPNSIPKPMIKPLTARLLEKLADSVPTVRDSATEALGAIMRVCVVYLSGHGLVTLCR